MSDTRDYTTNLHMVLPKYTETRDIGDINSNMEILDTAVAAKLAKNQGAGNAGKFMVVNSSGEIVPSSVPFASGVSF